MVTSEDTEEAIVAKDSNTLADMLQKLGADERIVEQVKTGQFSNKEVLTQLGELFAKASGQQLETEWKAVFRELIGSKDFRICWEWSAIR